MNPQSVPAQRLPRMAALLLAAAAVAHAQSESIAGGGSATYNPGIAFSGRRASDIQVYYPPITPILGSPLPSYNPTVGWPAPPWEVSEYVSEPFYPALGSRIEISDLPKRLRTRVDAYGVQKRALLKELQEKLESLARSDAETRERELAALAAAQSDRLTALEAEAEELRVDLIDGGLFHESVDWNYTRNWKLNEASFRTVSDGMVARLQVLRAGAYYQKGFTPAQRRLLREIATELAEAIDRLTPESDSPDSTATPPATIDANPAFFFAPETARFRLPASLPAAVRNKISAFEARKSAIKSELQETVAEKDSALFSISRTRAAEALARKQEAEIAALDEMADDIRRELARYPDAFKRPEPPNLSPPMLARMSAWVRDRRAMQHSVFVLVEDIKKTIHISRISYRRPGPGTESDPASPGRRTLSIIVSPEDRDDDEKLANVRRLVEKHTEENRPRAARLEAERLALRAELARFVPADASPAAVNTALDDAFDTLDRIEEWAMYSDYRTAMLQTGLSPAQRRLLFDAAIRALHLPLPPAERSLRVVRPY